MLLCDNKKRYSKKDAQTTCNRRNEEGARVRIYYCEFCNFWHLSGHDKYFYKRWERKLRK